MKNNTGYCDKSDSEGRGVRDPNDTRADPRAMSAAVPCHVSRATSQVSRGSWSAYPADDPLVPSIPSVSRKLYIQAAAVSTGCIIKLFLLFLSIVFIPKLGAAGRNDGWWVLRKPEVPLPWSLTHPGSDRWPIFPCRVRAH